MHLDVLDLRGFYYRTRLGRVAQLAIRDRLVALWPPDPGLCVAGFGFAVPLLRPWLEAEARVIALMPAQQGVMAWPPGQANVAVLCEETLWPLQGECVDRLVVMHGLETSENPDAVLDEAWRVLAPGGRAMFIVPNRAGIWSRSDATPFGFGRPYSARQLEAQLNRHDFSVERLSSALYAPPSPRAFWLRSADLWERAGARLLPWRGGGVLMAEVTKQVLAPRRRTGQAPVRAQLPGLAPARQGAGQPA
ncbi:MAG: methyltransferase domain-containing protein [Marivivens sp.]